MTSHDYQLLIITVVSILLLIFLITSKLRFHPLLALLLTAIFVGFTSGLDIDKIVKSIETGAGSTLGETGVTIALGAMLGKILSDSGASDRIATAIFKKMRHLNVYHGSWHLPHLSSAFQCSLK
ncbi:gluconate transporter [Staphylococcus gallinarum]|uniref:Gluconate transporter n=1 Tax=Staphylococcus gallinarum TaxID=1293 RepID=A0A380FBL6_STAGA|nr:gluconate transporter [Staphylococcus gallinarum]